MRKSGILAAIAIIILAVPIAAKILYASPREKLLILYIDFVNIQNKMRNCIPRYNTSDLVVMSCQSKALERHYILLNKVFILSQENAPSIRERKNLGISQKQWMHAWEKECSEDPAYLENGGGTDLPGTLSQVIYGSCKIDAYEGRIRQLLLQAR